MIPALLLAFDKVESNKPRVKAIGGMRPNSLNSLI
mgnify:CR=1 FL=1